MESFADVLADAGRSNSLGLAGEVVGAVLTDRGRLDELWACVGHDDAYVRMRPIDSFEKVINEQPAWRIRSSRGSPTNSPRVGSHRSSGTSLSCSRRSGWTTTSASERSPG